MKPQRIDLRGARSLGDVAKRVLETRLSEARTLAGALERRERLELHDFRIACKRLRYALERFEALDSTLALAADRLARLQDELGEVHDRDVLLAILPPAMGQTERRLQSEREACVDRAILLWGELRGLMQAVDSHHF
ncbi:MAG TPA: CHAD domain-containing protein [Candidatus Baltobacteraceae bacterium]|nr:CHAD domain-containing protein [Candidatus Baltobacteraceae bacterium]